MKTQLQDLSWKIPALAAALTLAGCASTDPRKISFPDQTDQALILMQVEPSGTAYTTSLADYDPAGQALTDKFTGTTRLDIDPSAQPTYVAATLPPGTYVFRT